MKKNSIQYLPLLLAMVSVFAIQNCKRPLRPESVLYNAKNKVAPLPFTSPSCAPAPDYVAGKKNGSSFFNLYYSAVNTGSTTSDARYFELRYPFGGNEYFKVNFVYLRKGVSANYEVMSQKTPQVDRTLNKVEVYGQISASFVDGNKGGYVHVRYLPGTDEYEITLCNLPMSYTPNSTGVSADITISTQFRSQ